MTVVCTQCGRIAKRCAGGLCARCYAAAHPMVMTGCTDCGRIGRRVWRGVCAECRAKRKAATLARQYASKVRRCAGG
jgi:NMD protein affecting ribosome stability and mRNA decay